MNLRNYHSQGKDSFIRPNHKFLLYFQEQISARIRTDVSFCVWLVQIMKPNVYVLTGCSLKMTTQQIVKVSIYLLKHFLYKPWKTKVFFQFEIIINVLFSCSHSF